MTLGQVGRIDIKVASKKRTSFQLFSLTLCLPIIIKLKTSNRQGEPNGYDARFPHSIYAEILVVVVPAFSDNLLVEEVVGRVRHKRLLTDVC